GLVGQEPVGDPFPGTGDTALLDELLDQQRGGHPGGGLGPAGQFGQTGGGAVLGEQLGGVAPVWQFDAVPPAGPAAQQGVGAGERPPPGGVSVERDRQVGVGQLLVQLVQLPVGQRG